MANFRSITQIGTSEPFELQVSRNQIPRHDSASLDITYIKNEEWV